MHSVRHKLLHRRNLTDLHCHGQKLVREITCPSTRGTGYKENLACGANLVGKAVNNSVKQSVQLLTNSDEDNCYCYSDQCNENGIFDHGRT